VTTNYRPRPEQPRGWGPHPGQGGNAPRTAFQPPTTQQLKAIIEDGDAKTLVESAQSVGQALAEMKLASSQIRSVFATTRQIQMKWLPGASEPSAKASIHQLLLLKPRLAYQASRDQGQAVGKLKQVLEPAIDLVTNREQFTHFAEYFEAILAYHKAAGGD